jgi:threonine aldolase
MAAELLNFASDNCSGIHPDVLAAIGDANRGFVKAYGDDPYTASAHALFRREFGEQAEILFTFGGTGANVVGIASVARSFEAVFCADCSHLWSDECAAPEKFFGGKLVPVPAQFGKITVDSIISCIGENRGVHHAKPKVISLTQPTEWGTLYRLSEMQEIAAFAHANDMLLHVDGARLSNAAAALGCSLAATSSDVGVDILSFGGTKNGLMGGEAIVFINPVCARDAGFIRKQATQLASKMRFISVQFEAFLTNDLWRRNAEHANSMAARLADHLASVPGVSFTSPVEVNALFPTLERRYIAPLEQKSLFYMWDANASIARWMTSYNTTSDDVDAFANVIKDVAKRA